MRQTTTGILLSAVLTLGMAGCSTTEDAIDPDPVSTSIDETSVAYGYFGSVRLASGTTINMTVDKVDSSADVTFIEAAEGIDVSIIDAADGSTRVEVKVDKNIPVGPQAITFDIAGEPEPVIWTIDIIG